MHPTGDHRLALLMEAAQAQKAGNFELAELKCRDLLAQDGNSAAGKFVLAVLLARKGDSSSAIELLEQVLSVDPNSPQVLVSLANLELERGNISRALERSSRAVALVPNDPLAQNNHGRALLADRRLGEAAAAFRKAIALAPNFAPAYHNLGKTVQWEGKDLEAAEAFGRAARLAPTLDNLIPFGQTLLSLCNFPAAEECARFCVSQFPESATAHLLLCGALIGLNRLPEAEAHLRKAISLDVDGSEVLQIAERQRPLGYMEEANLNLRKAIHRNPRHVSAYDSLMHNKKVTEEDRPIVDQLQSLLEDRSLGPTELASVHYGLGKAREDLKEYEAAMGHYDEANRITRQIKIGDIPFDEKRYTEHVNLQLGLPRDIGEAAESTVSDSELPILIVGMMRSGTTLAEQILSSHPDVAPAGELLFWSLNWKRALDKDPDVISKLGIEYLAVLRGAGPGAPRVTDKMPGNYHFAGLVHRALPNARFIHMRRSPADTCLSIWATPNHVPHEGAHNKADTVFVYRQYLRMMEEWRHSLPAGRLLEVDYESLVDNREEITRRMVDFCGLDWNEAYLYPEKNDRLVTTPSVWQVRQPVYKTSVARWKKFEPWLGDFEQLLAIEHPKA